MKKQIISNYYKEVNDMLEDDFCFLEMVVIQKITEQENPDIN